MISGSGDKTLQAHRGSYKTTCVSIAIAVIMILHPSEKLLFMRKTDGDVREVIRQVEKILAHPVVDAFVRCIYGVPLVLTTATGTEVSTNLSRSVKGTAQLVGMGIGGSITGKHFDRIFTDDIVNVSDRISKAERDHTKAIYQELQNIKNRGGRIYNTGTPWHKDDAFSIMPDADKWDYRRTGLISDADAAVIAAKMEPSLFAANYELRHIPSDAVLFAFPQTGAEPGMAEQGDCHIDAAYGGEDYTAFTICRKADGKYYVYGRLWRKHIDDVEEEIIELRRKFNAGKIYCEDNGDKGYLAKDLRKRGERVISYHENMNKFLKITSYLKAAWKDVIFVGGTDQAYIDQICEYTEDAEHDDAPDSAASIIRIFEKKGTTANVSLWG